MSFGNLNCSFYGAELEFYKVSSDADIKVLYAVVRHFTVKSVVPKQWLHIEKA